MPKPRSEFADDVQRAVVVAEARLLVNQLDRYLEMISEWVMGGQDA